MDVTKKWFSQPNSEVHMLPSGNNKMCKNWAVCVAGCDPIIIHFQQLIVWTSVHSWFSKTCNVNCKFHRVLHVKTKLSVRYITRRQFKYIFLHINKYVTFVWLTIYISKYYYVCMQMLINEDFCKWHLETLDLLTIILLETQLKKLI